MQDAMKWENNAFLVPSKNNHAKQKVTGKVTCKTNTTQSFPFEIKSAPLINEEAYSVSDYFHEIACMHVMCSNAIVMDADLNAVLFSGFKVRNYIGCKREKYMEWFEYL